MNIYTPLIEFCSTPRQTEIITYLSEGHTQPQASKKFGLGVRGIGRMISSCKKRQNAAGEGSHFIGQTNLRNTGLGVEKTTTCYRQITEEGAILQWVKANHKLENQYEAYIELLRDETSHIHEHYKKIKAPRKTIKNLITNYKTTDLHFGALMWHEETGYDYDLNIAKDTLLSSFKYLLDAAPNTETCIISDLGDMVEADDFTNMTKRSGNILDVDGRYPKILRVVRDTFVEIVNMALQKHKKVEILFIKGNHDDMTSFQVQEYLAGYFRNEKRVNVDTSLSRRKYYIFGRTLLGFTHGHEMKPNKCGEIMAHECREYFHKTVYRYFDFGHIHKDSSGENVICKWESHKNLPPSNDWAVGMGFMGTLGTMIAVTYCKDHGEQDRMTFSVSRMSEDTLSEYDSKMIQLTNKG